MAIEHITSELEYVRCVKFKEIEFIWTIQEAKRIFYPDAGVIKSPKFPRGKEEWEMSLSYEKYHEWDVYSKSYKEIPRLQVCVESDKQYHANGYNFNIRISKGRWLEGLRKRCFRGYINNLSHQDALDMLENGALTIHCSISESLSSHVTSDIRFLNDVECVTGEHRRPCSKALLSVVSPVFEKMFSVPMKENQENVIEFTDVLDKETMDDMITFVFTDVAPRITETHQKLLVAAFRYQMEDLKVQCQLHIVKYELTMETVMTYLKLAMDNDAEWLKDYCIRFIVRNFQKVKETDGWKNADNDLKIVVL